MKKIAITSSILLFFIICSRTDAGTFRIYSGVKADTLKAREWLDKVEAYSDSAKYDSAAFCYEQAAKIYKKARNWEKYIFCRNGVFVELRNKHDNTNFIPMVRENLALALKYLNAENSILGSSYMNIGHVYADRSNIDSALHYFNKGIEIWELHYGEEHIMMANAYGNIGVLYRKNAEYLKAEEYFKRAHQIRLDILGPDHPDVAYSLNSLGYVAYSMGKYDECREYFRKAIEIRESYYGEFHPLTAESYNNYAALCSLLEDYQQSLFYNNKALEARLKSLGSRNPNVALSYNNIGNVYLNLGEYDKAEEYHQKALKLRFELWGDIHLDVAQSIQNIGVLNFERGDYRKALENAMELLRILESIYGKDHPNLDDAYNNIGAAYEGLGDYRNAFYFLNKGLELRRQVAPDNPALIYSYNNVGAMFKYKGDYDMARSYYIKELELVNRYFKHETAYLAGAYSNLGELYFILKDYEEALKYFLKCRNIYITTVGENHPEIVSSLINISEVYAELDSIQKQAEIIQNGLEIIQAFFGENHPKAPILYSQMAMNLLKQGERDEAIAIQQKAIGLLNSLYIPPHPDIAHGYKDLGYIFAESGLYDSARYYYNIALELNYYKEFPDNVEYIEYASIIDELDFLEMLIDYADIEYKYHKVYKDTESLRSSVKTYIAATKLASFIREDFTLPDSKIIMLNNMADVYGKALRTSTELNRIDPTPELSVMSFNFSEMNKSATLLETMRRCRLENYWNIPDSLVKQERELLKQVGYYKSRITDIQISERDSIQPQLDYFNSRYANAMLELNSLRNRIEKHTVVKEITLTDSLFNISDIQSRLNEETLMLEYLISDSSVFVFILGNEIFEICEIHDISSLDDLIAEHLANIRRFKPDKLLSSSQLLYKILIKPVENYIASKKKLLIIPDKNLLYLPFETLVSEKYNKEDPTSTTPHYMIYDFEISYHYSATLWLEINSRERVKNNGFLGFAPVFTDENQVSANKNSTERFMDSFYDENVRSLVSADGITINALPYTRKEILTISDLFKAKNYTAKSYLLDQATEANLKEQCENFRYIHLATHGLINPDKPDLSGLVFTNVESNNTFDAEISRELEFSGNEHMNDGVLFANEIYNLRLNADLVVLSACETGVGKIEKGEGIMSLNRGFLYAGAQNIVFSFWKVNDKFTSELMTWFYTYIMEGISYSKALQLAKLKLLEDEETNYPLFWAGFAIIGE